MKQKFDEPRACTRGGTAAGTKMLQKHERMAKTELLLHNVTVAGRTNDVSCHAVVVCLVHYAINYSHFFLTFFPLFNTAVPLHSPEHNSQRLNRRNRGLVLVTSWSKELVLIKVYRG